MNILFKLACYIQMPVVVAFSCSEDSKFEEFLSLIIKDNFLEILALASAPSVTLPPPTKISSRLNHWRLIRQPAQTTGKH